MHCVQSMSLFHALQCVAYWKPGTSQMHYSIVRKSLASHMDSAFRIDFMLNTGISLCMCEFHLYHQPLLLVQMDLQVAHVGNSNQFICDSSSQQWRQH